MDPKVWTGLPDGVQMIVPPILPGQTTVPVQFVKVYATSDGQTTKSFEVTEAIPVTPRISHEGRTLICGDSLGEIHFGTAPGAP